MEGTDRGGLRDLMVATHAAKLRDLAAWYRERAEAASNRWTRTARLRTADELEQEAERIERREQHKESAQK